MTYVDVFRFSGFVFDWLEIPVDWFRWINIVIVYNVVKLSETLKSHLQLVYKNVSWTNHSILYNIISWVLIF